NVGKPKSSVNTSSHCGAVPKLNSYNMPQAFLHSPLGIFCQAFMCLQVPQAYHCSDTESLLIFLNGIQSQTGQVYGSSHVPAAHFQPHHTSQDTGGPLLV